MILIEVISMSVKSKKTQKTRSPMFMYPNRCYRDNNTVVRTPLSILITCKVTTNP